MEFSTSTPHNYRPLAEQERMRKQAMERNKNMGHTGYGYGSQRGIQSRLAKPEKGRVPDPLEPIRSLSPGERLSYSYRRAILGLVGGHEDHTFDCQLELELSAAIAERMGRPSKGIFVPLSLLPHGADDSWTGETRGYNYNRSGLDTKSGSAGGFTVATDVRDLIELLRNRLLCEKLGATVLSGLSGTVAFPVQLSGSTLAWVSENPGSDVGESDMSFGQRVMSPHEAMATTSFSRKLLVQSSQDIEALVRNDLVKAHANGIDVVAINGSGLSNQPLGILGTTGVNLVSMGSDGAVPSYAKLVDCETAVALANADSSNMKWATTPGLRGKLKQTQELPGVSGSPMVWKSEGGVDTLLGYPAFVSNNVPSTLVKGSSGAVCHAAILGDWSSLYIGLWGVLELEIDPYTLKKRAEIEVTSWEAVDVLLRQPAQFAMIVDCKLT